MQPSIPQGALPASSAGPKAAHRPNRQSANRVAAMGSVPFGINARTRPWDAAAAAVPPVLNWARAKGVPIPLPQHSLLDSQYLRIDRLGLHKKRESPSCWTTTLS
jgi:hypothetical protein